MVHNHSPAMGLMHVPSYKWGINNTIGTNMYIHMHINICIYICIYIYIYVYIYIYIYYGFVTCDWYMIMVRKYSNFLTVTKATPAGHRQDPHKPRLEANGASEVSWFAGKFRRLSGKSPIGCWFIWSQSTVCLCVFFSEIQKTTTSRLNSNVWTWSSICTSNRFFSQQVRWDSMVSLNIYRKASTKAMVP